MTTQWEHRRGCPWRSRILGTRAASNREQCSANNGEQFE